MFLDFYYLKKLPYRSSASRNSYLYFNKLNFLLKNRNLSVYKKWKAGRNDSGKIIIRTKSSFLKKVKSVNINYNLRYIKLGFISSFNLIPFKNKLLSFVIFSNGSFTYYLTNENHNLFSFIFFNFYKNLKKIKLKSNFFMLFQIKKLSFVSCLEITPGRGAQYCRSSGTQSRIIKFDKDNHSVLIKLPSDVKKIFSYYSFVMLGQLSLKDNKNFKNGKSGYWRLFGVKPLVRGVAMNPVDHPHGGRTKSVRYPRTPWGKTTKFK